MSILQLEDTRNDSRQVKRSAAGGTRLNFGEELQRERERQGVSLEAVAEGTKVQLRYLEALEADQFASLPGGVFNKGFVRSYCRFLGLDEDQWLARYDSTVSTEPEEQDWVTFAENVKRTRAQAGAGMRRRWWGVVLMLLLLGAMGWAAWRYVIRPRMQGHTQGAVRTMVLVVRC
jgi:cytoskeleton protein RodZ